MEIESELKTMCTNLRNLRGAYGFSQKKMAELLHISVKTLRRIESGEVPSRLTYDMLYWFRKNFNISISLLFEPNFGLEEPIHKDYVN